MATWYVRKGGSNSNGGTSPSLTPDKSGTGAAVTTGSTTLTITGSATSFAPTDVGKGLCLPGLTQFYRIAAYTSPTQITLDRLPPGSTSNLIWNIGGARLTINSVTGAASVLTGVGEVVWVGSGVYRETVTLATSSGGMSLCGDVDGTHTGDPAGQVQITAHLTSDKVAPSALTPLTVNSNWTVSNLFVVGCVGSGGANAPKALTVSGSGITITNCAFIGLYPVQSNAGVQITASGASSAIVIDKCRFLLDGGVTVTLPSSSVADYDAGVSFTNCVIDAGYIALTVNNSGALAFRGGGVRVFNCMLRGGVQWVVNVGSASSTYPVIVQNSIVWGSYSGAVKGLQAAVLGQLIEDHNLLLAGNLPRSNVAVGTGSISDGSYAPLWHMGQEQTWGATPRPYGMPTAGSPLLGFGNSANGQAVDLMGTPRPSGGASGAYAVGPYERPNAWGRETVTVHAGTNAWSITGPGTQDFLIPVQGSASTILSVYLRYDGTYTGTRPQFTVTGGSECGVAEQSVTATTAALGAWEQQSITVNPTSNGIITARLISNDTDGGGHAYADSFGIT